LNHKEPKEGTEVTKKKKEQFFTYLN